MLICLLISEKNTVFLMRVCATNVWPIKDYIMELVLKLAECKEASVI